VSRKVDAVVTKNQRRWQARLWLATGCFLLLLLAGLALMSRDAESGKVAVAVAAVGLVVTLLAIATIESFIQERKAKAAPKGACPRCHSTSVAGIKEGYSGCSGCCGSMLLGPLGLFCGFLGADEVNVHCLSCGHTWKAKR